MNRPEMNYQNHFDQNYSQRTYREKIKSSDLVSFQVKEKESDLLIQASQQLSAESSHYLKYFRHILEDYILSHPVFGTTLEPYPEDQSADKFIQKMIRVSWICQVGPMAAVAGCIAQSVGESLLRHTDEVMIENGGDLFIKSSLPRKVIIFAGRSPLSNQIFLKISSSKKGIGICTSSGTVGPSFSRGKADAVTTLSPSASLADAAATAIGNVIQTKRDIEKGINLAKSFPGITGVVIIKNDRLGMWGEIEYGLV